MKEINLKIVTPERIIFEGSCLQVTIPTKTGEITILPNHIPLISALQAGELVIKREDGEFIPMAISKGFLEVQPNSQVVILADSAERVEEIDHARAEEAKKRAEALLKEKRADIESYVTLSAKIEKELARLKVARKHRKRK